MLPVLFVRFFSLITFITALDIQDRAIGKEGRVIQLCGFRSTPLFPLDLTRIVNGTVSQRNKYPWQISLQVSRRGRRLQHVCGATIIGASWILTAAHCTRAYGIRNMVAVAGALNLKDKNEIFDRQTVRLSRLFEHPKYEERSQTNDIALIKTRTPFIMDGIKPVAPACLPDPYQEFSGKCVVTGWGTTDESTRVQSPVLLNAAIPLMSDDECRKRFKKAGFNFLIIPAMQCAGYLEGKIDACQGDSGGPFVCPGAGNLPMLTGIVSWGVGCARKGFPGVYTQVSHYITWIESIILGDTQKPVRSEVPLKQVPSPLSRVPTQPIQPTDFVPGSHLYYRPKIYWYIRPLFVPVVYYSPDRSSEEDSSEEDD